MPESADQANRPKAPRARRPTAKSALPVTRASSQVSQAQATNASAPRTFDEDKVESRQLAGGQQDNPQRRSRARRWLAGIEGKTAPVSQVIRKAVMDVGVVERNAGQVARDLPLAHECHAEHKQREDDGNRVVPDLCESRLGVHCTWMMPSGIRSLPSGNVSRFNRRRIIDAHDNLVNPWDVPVE
jgi:hypothetical protein